MNTIQKVAPRVGGHGWELAKFHEFVHYVVYIVRLGSAQNFDTGIGKKNLKLFATGVAATAQKREGVFQKQVAERLHQYEILREVTSLFNLDDETYKTVGYSILEDREGTTTKEAESVMEGGVINRRGTRFDITVSAPTDVSSKKMGVVQTWGPADQPGQLNSKKDQLPEHALRFLGDFYPPGQDGQNTTLYCFTEVWSMGLIFRAHPSYRVDDKYLPWFDWATVNFEYGTTNKQAPVPCKIITFFMKKKPHRVLAENLDPEDVFLLVHACAWRKDGDQRHDTAISERWALATKGNKHSPALYVVQLCDVKERVFVVEEGHGDVAQTMGMGLRDSFPRAKDRRIIMVHVKSTWADSFMGK